MYIIDGHNLIPKIPGLSLRDMDDEQQLIDLLVRFCTARQKSALVFFDRAPAGFAGKRPYGRVTAQFVGQGMIADEAIRRHLAGLGRAARNVTVVSSDRQVQAEAASRQATVVSSDAFAAELVDFRRAAAVDPPAPKGKGRQPTQAASMTSDELQEFLDMFGGEPTEGVPPPPERKKKKKK